MTLFSSLTNNRYEIFLPSTVSQLPLCRAPKIADSFTISTHAAASDRDKDKNNGQREQQQYGFGCDDGNLATGLPPSGNADKQACKRGEKHDSDNKSEERNAKKPKCMVIVGDHKVALVL